MRALRGLAEADATMQVGLLCLWAMACFPLAREEKESRAVAMTATAYLLLSAERLVVRNLLNRPLFELFNSTRPPFFRFT